MTYSAPSITDLGSVKDFTLDFNKIGQGADQYSAIVPLVGSVVSPR